MKNRNMGKLGYGIAVAAAVFTLCNADYVVKAAEENSVVGTWCVTGGHAAEKIEFHEDGTMRIGSGKSYTEGIYEVNDKGILTFALENTSGNQNSSDTLHWKVNGDHLALLAEEEEMEMSIITAYYTREETVDEYDTEDDIEGIARRAWTVKSGVDTIEIAGEKYDADQMYYVFGMNLLQIGEPDEIGAPVYTKMLYAPYEYEKGCGCIYFFFNEPFSEETGVRYEMKLSEDELKFTAEDGKEIVFEAVKVNEAE